MVNKRKNPEFVRWPSASVKRIKSTWRRPKGINSKIAVKKKGKLPMPAIGYGAPRDMRHLHPSGFRELLVHNAEELKKLDAAKEAARIAASVGKKKRADIMKMAGEMKIKILNPSIHK